MTIWIFFFAPLLYYMHKSENEREYTIPATKVWS